MCIAIPGKITSILVDIGGIKRKVNLDLIGGADSSLIGKNALVHVGYAISLISDEESKEILKLLRDVMDLS